MRIANGKKYFYQWERKQKLEVPETCNIVFFSNGTLKDAWGIDVVEGFVDVPDELLQTASELNCYGWDDASTTVIVHAAFRVEPMPKPGKYAYTPTEVKRYDEVMKLLQERGAYYIPSVDADGNLTWIKSLDQLPDVPGSNIKGPKGDRGERGPKGEKGDPGGGGVGGNAINDSVISKDYSWSSQNTVDKLCPSFSESGAVVVCEPIEGYPLRVSTELPTDHGVSKITLYHEGLDEAGDEVSTEYTVDFGEAYFDGYYDWETGELRTEEEGTMQFAPQVITAFFGRNSFRSDCGDTTVGGMADPNKYWAEKLAEQETIIAEQEAAIATMNKQYELIEDVTLDEAVASFTRTADTNGNPYNFSAMRIYVEATAAEGANNNSQMIFSLGTKSNNFAIYLQVSGGITNTARNTLLNAQNENGFRSVWFATATSGGTSTNIQTRSAHYTYIWENVTRLALSTHPSTLKIPAGTRIRIYGIRG